MSKKIFSLCIILALFISVAMIIRVSAQSDAMTTDQINQIRTNCVSTKNTLSQLHASDALLRVNRGQMFESMSTKLMNRFNSRLANNGYKNSDFLSITSSYGTILDTFRLDYKAYEEQLSSAIGINCQNQPVVFYDSVVSARTKRNQVHADVVRLNQYIDQYQVAVNQFENDYQTAAQGIKQ